MTNATGRSAAAKKASETRKRNRYQAKRDEAIQSARRDYLYDKLTDEQREAIDEQLTYCDACHEFENYATDEDVEALSYMAVPS
jgi:hypothetical protein